MKCSNPAIYLALISAALVFVHCLPEESSENSGGGFDIAEEECVPGVDPECPLDCEDIDTWPSTWLDESEEVLQQVNDVRAQGAVCGGEEMAPAKSVAIDSALEEAARCHALDMAEQDELGHDGSDGSDEVERAADAGYPSEYVGENLAAGQSSAAVVVDAWLESETHCENLMHEHYEDTGVAVVQLKGRMYWVQIFGR